MYIASAPAKSPACSSTCDSASQASASTERAAILRAMPIASDRHWRASAVRPSATWSEPSSSRASACTWGSFSARPSRERLLQDDGGVRVAVQKAQHRAGLAEAMRLVVHVAERAREFQRLRHLREPLRVLLLRAGGIRGGARVAARLREERLVEQQLGEQVAVAARLRELDAGGEVPRGFVDALGRDQRGAEGVVDVDLERVELLRARGLERAEQRYDRVVVRAQPVLAQADAGEGGRGARQVAAVLVELRGLQHALERGHEVGEVEVAARERMQRLGVELAVAAARGDFARFLREFECLRRLPGARELGGQRVQRAHPRRRRGRGVDGIEQAIAAGPCGAARVARLRRRSGAGA